MVAWRLRVESKNLALEALNRSIYNGQTGLAQAAQLAFATVNNFFNCKNIFKANFEVLCELLQLDPHEVRDLPSQQFIAPYVLRANEQLWYEKILEPQILIRILAPSQFGKTSLMCRMLDRARQQGHLAIFINLAEIETENLANPQVFLHQSIGLIECAIEDIDASYVDALMSAADYENLVSRFGSTKACLKYLEYFQKNIAKPLTLGIDKLDRLLDYPDTARTFFALLRLMHEKSTIGGSWENFRMVLAHATPAIEQSIDISDNQSPFNIGVSIELPEFTPTQVAELAAQRKLSLSPAQIDRLMQPIGGIPYLIKLTLDRIQKDGVDIIERDPTAIDSIYQEHLHSLGRWLHYHNLQSAMERVVQTPDGTTNLPFQTQCLLHRHGAIVFTSNGIIARCQLYRQYFLPLGSDVSR
jgi:AAA-like domain